MLELLCVSIILTKQCPLDSSTQSLAIIELLQRQACLLYYLDSLALWQITNGLTLYFLHIYFCNFLSIQTEMIFMAIRHGNLVTQS